MRVVVSLLLFVFMCGGSSNIKQAKQDTANDKLPTCIDDYFLKYYIKELKKPIFTKREEFAGEMNISKDNIIVKCDINSDGKIDFVFCGSGMDSSGNKRAFVGIYTKEGSVFKRLYFQIFHRNRVYIACNRNRNSIVVVFTPHSDDAGEIRFNGSGFVFEYYADKNIIKE